MVQGFDKVMFEVFLLRVYYLNDLEDVDCKTMPIYIDAIKKQ
jgi:hypothetical protein